MHTAIHYKPALSNCTLVLHRETVFLCHQTCLNRVISTDDHFSALGSSLETSSNLKDNVQRTDRDREHCQSNATTVTILQTVAACSVGVASLQ